mmetsp:Transcript_76544/g.140128  ORF Transcript_76544/g.140128 Transcript_76544/m.140128 type:complete len:488 (+) Transcript_76544:32-1495(+)
MCAVAHSSAVPAGPHAQVEEVASNSAGSRELRLTIDVPFELRSMAEAELDVGATCVQLRGPAPALEAVKVPLPDGLALDPELASAKYSRKKRQLVITSPVPAHAPAVKASAAAAPASPPPAAAAEAKVEAAQPPAARAAAPPAAKAQPASQPAAATPAASAEDDDDDDDCPPPLEAVRSAPRKPATTLRAAAEATAGPEAEGVPDHTNEANEALMKKALAAREQKRRETEEAHRKADLGSGGAIKKGFLTGSKAKRSPPKPDKRQQAAEEVPFITGAADPEAARIAGLQLPEVQKVLKEGAKQLKEDSSWVTPQLLQALASRPDLSKAMQNPRIQEAMQLMQADPEAAKHRYKDDAEVTSFLKDFSGLMATHFDVLSKEAPTQSRGSSGSAAAPAAPAPAAAAAPLAKPPRRGEIMSAEAVQGHSQQPLPIADPKIAALLQDPEVMQLIAALRAGQPLEFHELARSNERLFMKVKMLLDNGLLDLQR